MPVLIYLSIFYFNPILLWGWTYLCWRKGGWEYHTYGTPSQLCCPSYGFLLVVPFRYRGQCHPPFSVWIWTTQVNFLCFLENVLWKTGEVPQFNFPVVGVLPGTLLKVWSRPAVPVQPPQVCIEEVSPQAEEQVLSSQESSLEVAPVLSASPDISPSLAFNWVSHLVSAHAIRMAPYGYYGVRPQTYRAYSYQPWPGPGLSPCSSRGSGLFPAYSSSFSRQMGAFYTQSQLFSGYFLKSCFWLGAHYPPVPLVLRMVFLVLGSVPVVFRIFWLFRRMILTCYQRILTVYWRILPV